MGTLGGFPNPPALWLRRAKPGYAYAIMGTLGGQAFQGAGSGDLISLPNRNPIPSASSLNLPTTEDWKVNREDRRNRDGMVGPSDACIGLHLGSTPLLPLLLHSSLFFFPLRVEDLDRAALPGFLPVFSRGLPASSPDVLHTGINSGAVAKW